MDKLIGISEAARRYGVSKRTLRYYEEIGVLDSIRKEYTNYRYYNEAQLIKLEQILLLKNLGFTMAEADHILQSDDRLIARGTLSNKLKEIERDIDELVSLKSVFKTMLKISDEEGSAELSTHRILREHPYLHRSIERRINMKTDIEEKFIIEFGIGLAPYSTELTEGIKALRIQLESTFEKKLPLVRVRDSATLQNGEYHILVNGEIIVKGDVGILPGKGAISVLLDDFRAVVYKTERKHEIKTISVLGLGYIGLPTAITLALTGFEVQGFDVSTEVIDTLQKGKIHIIEPGLQQALDQALENKQLTFSNELQSADAFYICVPTPFINKEGGKR